MRCFECEKELDTDEVDNGRVYKHDRYAGKNKPLCKFCRKPVKMNYRVLSDGEARNWTEQWKRNAE